MSIVTALIMTMFSLIDLNTTTEIISSIQTARTLRIQDYWEVRTAQQPLYTTQVPAIYKMPENSSVIL